ARRVCACARRPPARRTASVSGVRAPERAPFRHRPRARSVPGRAGDDRRAAGLAYAVLRVPASGLAAGGLTREGPHAERLATAGCTRLSRRPPGVQRRTTLPSGSDSLTA